MGWWGRVVVPTKVGSAQGTLACLVISELGTPHWHPMILTWLLSFLKVRVDWKPCPWPHVLDLAVHQVTHANVLSVCLFSEKCYRAQNLHIVKPESKVPKSRPKGLGLTLKSHGSPPHGCLYITTWPPGTKNDALGPSSQQFWFVSLTHPSSVLTWT